MTSRTLLKSVSNDGRILNVASGDLGNAQTRYTYIPLTNEGYLYLSCQHIITATTLTIEGTNCESVKGSVIEDAVTASDGTGATLVCSRLNSVNGFATDDDLIGCYVTITNDVTTPSNVGLTREIVDYAGATGTVTLASAFGATTSGVTHFKIIDNPNAWGRLVSHPTTTQWADVTSSLTGAASHTASGIWIISAPVAIEWLRIKRVTTNATNALALRLMRAS